MDIWGKLDLDMDRHRMVALVGAGGKTSTMYALARQARDRGRTVIVTTTTHIMPHPGISLTGETDPERLRALAQAHGVVTAGRFDRPDKLSGAAEPETCKAAADVVLVEADGARIRPLKVPADHEPVIPPCADAVIAAAGMDCVGRAVGEICHRPERVAALLGVGLDHVLVPADVAKVLLSPQGGRKGVGERPFRVLLNKADDPRRADHAREIQALLAQAGVHSAITYYTEEERGGRCWF